MPDPTRKNPLGPVGRRAAENVAALREADRLSYKELSDRLGELGRPIPTLGLSRIERGERRIDTDDLMAIAVTLDATPNTLLLPMTARTDVDVALTPNLEVSAESAWSWAQANVPLEARQRELPADQVNKFLTRNVPEYPGYRLPEIAKHIDLVSEIVGLIRKRAQDIDVHPTEVLNMVTAVVHATPRNGAPGVWS